MDISNGCSGASWQLVFAEQQWIFVVVVVVPYVCFNSIQASGNCFC